MVPADDPLVTERRHDSDPGNASEVKARRAWATAPGLCRSISCVPSIPTTRTVVRRPASSARSLASPSRTPSSVRRTRAGRGQAVHGSRGPSEQQWAPRPREGVEQVEVECVDGGQHLQHERAFGCATAVRRARAARCAAGRPPTARRECPVGRRVRAARRAGPSRPSGSGPPDTVAVADSRTWVRRSSTYTGSRPTYWSAAPAVSVQVRRAGRDVRMLQPVPYGDHPASECPTGSAPGRSYRSSTASMSSSTGEDSRSPTVEADLAQVHGEHPVPGDEEGGHGGPVGERTPGSVQQKQGWAVTTVVVYGPVRCGLRSCPDNTAWVRAPGGQELSVGRGPPGNCCSRPPDASGPRSDDRPPHPIRQPRDALVGPGVVCREGK